MHVCFLSIVIHAAHPRSHIDITHPFSSYRRLVQNNISRVPDYYTQFISTDNSLGLNVDICAFALRLVDGHVTSRKWLHQFLKVSLGRPA